MDSKKDYFIWASFSFVHKVQMYFGLFEQWQTMRDWPLNLFLYMDDDKQGGAGPLENRIYII